jgi:hypothetical protein
VFLWHCAKRGGESLARATHMRKTAAIAKPVIPPDQTRLAITLRLCTVGIQAVAETLICRLQREGVVDHHCIFFLCLR